ncbi:hypothetical protein GCM10010402_30750 [Actinomadura luteofluorescens]|nr:hypothetical protein [Actinomadura glauciflava]
MPEARPFPARLHVATPRDRPLTGTNVLMVGNPIIGRPERGRGFGGGLEEIR